MENVANWLGEDEWSIESRVKLVYLALTREKREISWSDIAEKMKKSQNACANKWHRLPFCQAEGKESVRRVWKEVMRKIIQEYPYLKESNVVRGVLQKLYEQKGK